MNRNMKKPNILFVDDVVEDVEAVANECQKYVNVVERSFDDVDTADLDNADLILIDFNLNDWPTKDTVPQVALRPEDGLAVVEIFRSYFRSTKTGRPVALAVLSGDLASLTNPFPPARREHLVADLAKVEWAFQKDTPSALLSSQLVSLADAVQQLPKKWPPGSNAQKEKVLHKLLGIPQIDWATVASDDVSRCYPPVRELSAWSHGLALLRWMLQRILPYPAFLLDDAQVAVRIGITIDSFCSTFKRSQRFRKWIQPAEYTGVLKEFRGRRWWKAGIDALLWELSQEKPFDKDVVTAGIKRIAPHAQLLKGKNSVVCVDSDYKAVGVADADECIRLRPDDWPLFADAAWAEKKLVANNQALLMAVEDFDERTQLEANAR